MSIETLQLLRKEIARQIQAGHSEILVPHMHSWALVEYVKIQVPGMEPLENKAVEDLIASGKITIAGLKVRFA